MYKEANERKFGQFLLREFLNLQLNKGLSKKLETQTRYNQYFNFENLIYSRI